jgi:uncharacterized C2H2 Zn-finger protein
MNTDLNNLKTCVNCGCVFEQMKDRTFFTKEIHVDKTFLYKKYHLKCPACKYKTEIY